MSNTIGASDAVGDFLPELEQFVEKTPAADAPGT